MRGVARNAYGLCRVVGDGDQGDERDDKQFRIHDAFFDLSCRKILSWRREENWIYEKVRQVYKRFWVRMNSGRYLFDCLSIVSRGFL